LAILGKDYQVKQKQDGQALLDRETHLSIDKLPITMHISKLGLWGRNASLFPTGNLDGDGVKSAGPSTAAKHQHFYRATYHTLPEVPAQQGCRTRKAIR
jgi:hypothetical protein